MAMNDDEDSAPSDTIGALMAASNTTTPEAKTYAKKYLDQPDVGDSAEQAIRGEIAQRTEASKKALQDARARLLARRVDPTLAYLQAASGFLAPTKYGRFSESVGNVASNLVPVVQARQNLESDRDKQLLDIDSALANAGGADVQSQMEWLKAKQAQQAKMRVEALKVMGREIGGRNGQNSNLSPNGKQARDEGNPVDSPQWNARVAELNAIQTKQKNAEAGVDSAELTPDQRVKRARMYGVPMPAVDPYQGMSTKRKMQAQETDQREAEQEMKGIPDEIDSARVGLSKADRFWELNRENPTGPVMGRLPALSAPQQEMEAIGSELSRKMRVKGEGSTSDFDAKQFAKATFGRDKAASANKSIIEAFKMKEQNALDHASFRQSYYGAHGHLRGAQDAWNQYLHDNPIFDPSTPGQYNLNPNRIDYKTYFRSQLDNQGHAMGGRIHYDAGGAVRSAVQGATMGAGDELEAAVSPGQYDQNEKEARGSILNEQEQNPLIAAGAQASGTALLMKGVQTAKRMGMTNAAIRLVPKHELMKLAIVGGVFGAGQGAMSGEDIGDRTQSGLEGMIMGSTAGPLAGLATKYGMMGAGNLIARSPLSKDPTTPADRRVMDAIERDQGVNPAARLRQASQLKVPSTFGTSGGENLHALGKASVLEGDQTSDQMATEAANRMSGSRGRVEERVNQSLKPDEYFNKMDDLTSNLYQNAKPLYEAAYSAHPAIKSEKLRGILETDAGEKAVKEAIQFYNNQPGKKIGPTDAMGMVQNPSLEFYDKVKQGFDQLIAKEESQGPTPLGKTMRNLRGQLVSELDNQAPEYSAARAQYKGDLEVRDALRSGREDFNRMTPEEVRRAVGDMSFAERDAFRSGVAQKMYESINGPTGDYDAAKRLIGSPNTAQKLEAVFDKPSEAKLFNAALQREMEEFHKSKDIASAAGPARLARASGDPSIVAKLGSSIESLPYRSSMLANAWNLIRMHPDMTSKTADQVASILKETDPKIATNYMSRLAEKSGALARRKGRAGKVGVTMAAITGALTAPPPHESNVEEQSP